MLSVECFLPKILRRPRHRKREIKRRALPRLARGPDFSTVTLHDVFDDRQAETGSALFAGTGFVDAIKPLEHALQSLGRNARTVVTHADLDRAIAGELVVKSVVQSNRLVETCTS